MPNLKPVPLPRYCRREAYDLFAAQLPNLRSNAALVRAAVAISMHQLDDANPDAVLAQLEAYAARIKERARSGLRRAIFAHGHQYLFDNQRFRGNQQDYYNPTNSYLSKVLATRRGLPVSLCLIYKVVFELLEIEVTGINSPGHFLISVEMDGEATLVDPFSGGQILTREEAYKRIQELSGFTRRPGQEVLIGAAPEDWLIRLLSNLENLFQRSQQRQHVAAMMELRALLPA
ncbi:MAG: transglutaminase family protein [Planctomycetota bacterium]